MIQALRLGLCHTMICESAHCTAIPHVVASSSRLAIVAASQWRAERPPRLIARARHRSSVTVRAVFAGHASRQPQPDDAAAADAVTLPGWLALVRGAGLVALPSRAARNEMEPRSPRLYFSASFHALCRSHVTDCSAVSCSVCGWAARGDVFLCFGVFWPRWGGTLADTPAVADLRPCRPQ